MHDVTASEHWAWSAMLIRWRGHPPVRRRGCDARTLTASDRPSPDTELRSAVSGRPALASRGGCRTDIGVGAAARDAGRERGAAAPSAIGLETPIADYDRGSSAGLRLLSRGSRPTYAHWPTEGCRHHCLYGPDRTDLSRQCAVRAVGNRRGLIQGTIGPVFHRCALSFLLAVTVAVPLRAAPVAAATTSAPTRWLGRTDPSTKRFGWPGSGFELRFTGTRVTVVLDDNGSNSLIAEVDGEPVRLDLSKGAQSYEVAQGLTNGPHTLRFFRRTEGSFGPTRFVSADTDGTFGTADPAPAKRRNILVIGDSISAGYGIEGRDVACAFSADTENAYLTYGAVAARALQADATVLAYSGRGLVRNYDGSSRETLPYLMDRTIPTEPRSSQGTSDAPSFDVVVVHLGTNDFGSGNRPATFEATYVDFLKSLRDRYPTASIYAAIGPMLNGPDLEAAVNAISAAVDARRHDGDVRVHAVKFDPVAGGLGCGWHPNSAAQSHMADVLKSMIAKDLKWSDR
jgi:lysophospholipase L1-like esterase